MPPCIYSTHHYTRLFIIARLTHKVVNWPREVLTTGSDIQFLVLRFSVTLEGEGAAGRVIDYCQYADDDWPGRYRKRTSIWTNTGWYPARPLCVPSTCHFCTDGKKHDHMAQRRAKDGTPEQTLNQLYSIPPALPEELVKWLGANLLEKEE